VNTLQPLPVPDALPPPDDLGLVAGADLLDALADQGSAPEPDLGAVPTGVAALDRPGGGLALGTLTVVTHPLGGRSVTRLLLRSALHAAGQERPTLFCALDMPRLSFASVLAEAVTCRGGREGRPGEARDREGLRAAAQELRGRPLFVTVGATVGFFDLLAMAESEWIEFIVVDNLDLLLPEGSAADLKRCAVDLHAAVLASTTVSAGDNVDLATLGPEVVRGADTVARCESEADCRVLVTRT
jgi:hypothetical protein